MVGRPLERLGKRRLRLRVETEVSGLARLLQARVAQLCSTDVIVLVALRPGGPEGDLGIDWRGRLRDERESESKSIGSEHTIYGFLTKITKVTKITRIKRASWSLWCLWSL
jgi:hypothetical protein